MAESSNPTQISSPPDATPKEEPVTLDRPEILNPFLPTDQVEFYFDQITFTTNNEVAILYLEHLKFEYFQIVSDFISKYYLREAFTRAPNQYKEYLSEFWYTTKTLEESKIWVSSPTRGIRGELEYMMPTYDNEERTIHPTHVFSVLNWALKLNQYEGPPFTVHMLAIYNTDEPVVPKAPKTSSHFEKVPQGKKPRARSRLKRKQSSKYIFESKTKASKSKTGQSNKETQSSPAKDKSPSHPSGSTPVVLEMHKEELQAASGPTSLGATSEDKTYPQLSSGTNETVLVDQTTSAGDGLKTAHTNLGITKEYRSDELSKKIKLGDLSDLMKDIRFAFFTPDSLQDEPINFSNESEEVETKKDKETHATSHDVPEDTLKNAKAEAEVASLKAKPSYLDIYQLTELLRNSGVGEIQELKRHVLEMEIEIPGHLNNIPIKLETFTSTVSSLMYQVAELKTLKWELPTELLALRS
ncbi:hypothetical protein Tco_1313700 [Tanacetum coccineum]